VFEWSEDDDNEDNDDDDDDDDAAAAFAEDDCVAVVSRLVISVAINCFLPRQGLGFGLGFGVWGLGFVVCGLGFVVWGLGIKVRDLLLELMLRNAPSPLQLPLPKHANRSNPGDIRGLGGDGE